MFRNYFITAFNNLLKNKLFSLINIIGLSVGLAACILITLYVQNELSYDQHWDDADRIFRVNNENRMPGSEVVKSAATPLGVLPAINSFFPEEVEAATRVRTFTTDLSVNNAVYHELLTYADKEFAELFNLEMISGRITWSCGLSNADRDAARPDASVVYTSQRPAR